MTFIDPNVPEAQCLLCKSMVKQPVYLKIGNYRIPLTEGQKIFKCQVMPSDASLCDVYGVVVKNPVTGKLGIKNTSGVTWSVTLPDGNIKNIMTEKGLPAVPDLKIKLNNGIIALTTI